MQKQAEGQVMQLKALYMEKNMELERLESKNISLKVVLVLI
jgi:hypothetical protein